MEKRERIATLSNPLAYKLRVELLQLFPGAALVEVSQQSGRVPVNPGQATVYPDEAPAEPWLSLVMPRRAPVKAGSVPAEPRYTATPPALTGDILASDPGKATATPGLTPVIVGYAKAEPR
ncbi:hypothetical protein DPMN_098386 [Dreissena polymorpha]|uniref:Uncharacterized protein n=1 Tax=Dreissena polymorpha TaxID=45954 RepID=A0A9D4LCX7_DREPO|nr:hypothetical protein DPMN_098386 [Dreissena polymorpha]